MKVSCSVGTAVPYEEFMALINDVFGFTGTGRDFRTLLPKLYRPGRSPQCENYVVTEDGRCVAAVGAFSHKISVCGIAPKRQHLVRREHSKRECAIVCIIREYPRLAARQCLFGYNTQCALRLMPKHF